MTKKHVFSLGIGFSLSLILFFSFSFKAFQKQKSFHSLGEKIAQEADKLKIDYCLLIKDLNFPRVSLNHKHNQEITAASLLKLPILAVTFYSIAQERISLDQTILIKGGDIAGGSGKLKTMKLPYSLKLSQLLEFMISYSDNTATNKLIDILGFDYINQTFQKLGLKKTVLNRKMMDFSQRKRGVENYTSASDISLILERIYDRRLINKQFSELALKFLKEQKVNDRLPRYLPQGIIVAHKTGLERGVVHDAGIVFVPGADYIICVLVQGQKDYRKAKKFIAQTSRLTYNLYDK